MFILFGGCYINIDKISHFSKSVNGSTEAMILAHSENDNFTFAESYKSEEERNIELELLIKGINASLP